MSYTIDYGKLPKEEARAKALEDIEFFLGTERMAKIHEIFVGSLRAGPSSEDEQLFGMEMVGVRGFPAQVWLEEIRKSAASAG